MATRDQIGPCPHGIIDEICWQCTIDNYWRAIVEEIPSRHIRGDLATRCVGFRRHMALLCTQRAARHQATRYLEVGVRMGHSLALVALAAGERLEAAVGIDLWAGSYAGEPNRRPEDVHEALRRLRIDVDPITLYAADSHVALPEMRAQGRRSFNLILVDGDHTAEGARADLLDSFAMLEPGGVLVFDDAVYRADDTLLEVWRGWVADLHGDGVMIDGQGTSLTPHEMLDDEPGWCWVRRAP